MSAATDSSTDGCNLGGSAGFVSSWISDQIATGGSAPEAEDSSTDYMAVDSAVDPDQAPEGPALDTGLQAAGGEGEREAEMAARDKLAAPREASAEGGLMKEAGAEWKKDSGPQIKEEPLKAAAEPNLTPLPSAIGGPKQVEVGKLHPGLVAAESPDADRAWMGRNPRKAAGTHKPQLASPSPPILTDTTAQLPSLPTKTVWESSEETAV